MTLIGRTSVRTVLLTSLLLTSVLLVTLARAEDVATLEQTLPATSERPRSHKGESMNFDIYTYVYCVSILS